jgi:hypothetical protein
MANRFKKLRDEYNEQLKDKNPKAKLYSANDMYKEMKSAGFKVSKEKIKKIESNQYGVQIDSETLLAYKWKFNVSADWLIDESVSTRHLTGDNASASQYLGLSDATIDEITELNPDYKMILDKMISRYSFLYVLKKIRNLLGYNELKPHVKLTFDEYANFNDGAEIDQLLIDAINDNDISTFFNETVNAYIKDVIDKTILDEDLKKYFGEKDRNSKIKTILTTKDLPIFNPDTGKLEPRTQNPKEMMNNGSD